MERISVKVGSFLLLLLPFKLKLSIIPHPVNRIWVLFTCLYQYHRLLLLRLNKQIGGIIYWPFLATNKAEGLKGVEYHIEGVGFSTNALLDAKFNQQIAMCLCFQFQQQMSMPIDTHQGTLSSRPVPPVHQFLDKNVFPIFFVCFLIISP